MGLPAIDESLDRLLVAMEAFPNVAILGNTIGFARVLGLLLALCVGSYECWMMMLGRRGMDVMKLLRIIGISMCISSSSWICSALQVPGKSLESTTKAMAMAKNREVAALELKVAQKQGEYLERLRAVQDSISTAKQIAEIGEDANWWDKLIYNVENLGTTINNYAQRAAGGGRANGNGGGKDRRRICRGADLPDVLLRHTRGAEDIHSDNDCVLPDNVRPVAGSAVELGVEPVDVEIPLPDAVGLRDLYVPLLYRLHPYV